MQDLKKKRIILLKAISPSVPIPLPFPGIRRAFVELHAYGRKPTTPNNCWPTMLGLHVARSLPGFKVCVTTPKNMQQDATGCAKERNMYHPTMLLVVG